MIRRIHVIAVVVITSSARPTPGVLLRADDEIPRELVELIERLEWEEQAYRNIDVTLQIRYASRSTSPNEVVAYLRQVRHLRQDDRFVLEMTYSRGPRHFEHKALASDGETLRFLATADPGSEDYRLGPEEVREYSALPHTYIQPGTRRDVPLSAQLTGRPTDSREAHQILYAGSHDFNGLKCEVVRMTVTRSDPGRDPYVLQHREYWLAVERNYIPVRVLTIQPHYSDVTPTAEGVVDKIREIEPGMWFPWRATYTLYNRRQIERNGEQQIAWQKSYHTLSATPGPDFSDDYFRDIGFDDLVLDPRAP